MEYSQHITRAAREFKGIIQVPAMRRIAIERRHGQPDPVGTWIDTDPRLLKFKGLMAGVARIRRMGEALMEALEEQWPQFHQSIHDDQVLLTSGTTISFTGRTKPHRVDDRFPVWSTETLSMTWDYEEPFSEANGRLNHLRRTLEQLPDYVVRKTFATDYVPGIPPPQALLSDVISAGDDWPQTSLFGCGGMAPISISVGVSKTHWVVDHRLHDPEHYLALIRSFQKHLDERLQ